MEINDNYEKCLKIINVLNINMNDLYNYYKMNNKNENEEIIEEIVEEIVDNMIKKEINEENIKKEEKIEKKEEKINIKKSLFPKTETKRWGDYDSDDENECKYIENPKKLETEFKTFKDIVKKNDVEIIKNVEKTEFKTYTDIVKKNNVEIIKNVEKTDNNNDKKDESFIKK